MVWFSAQVIASCQSGWESHSSNCYYASDTKANWDHARAECQSMNGDLVSISDAAENNFVNNIAYVHTSVKMCMIFIGAVA